MKPGPLNTFTVSLPLPPAKLSPNGTTGRGWRGKAKAVKSYRVDCQVSAICARSRQPVLVAALRAHPVAKLGPVRMRIEYFCGGGQKGDGHYRPLDEDNAVAALKAGIDGIVDAGVLPGDSRRNVALGGVQIHRTKKEHGGRAEVLVHFDW